MNTMRLKNKVAIITGGAQGIGESMACVFIKEGARVLICDKIEAQLETTAQNIRKSFPTAVLEYAVCDITLPEQVQPMVQICVNNLGDPSVLINNAGVNVFNEPLKTTHSEWQHCMDNNLTGAWNCAKAVLKYMIKNKDGSIINISSVHGHKIIPGCFPYPVAKHGILGLTKALGVEYAKYNVRVNSISPGLIETPLTLQWYETSVAKGLATDVESFRRQQSDLLPCKRVGTPQEVAMLAVLLASDESRFINATDILMDGGRSALYHE